MNAVEKTKSLRVEHLSDIIADLRVQKEDRISELCDLKKVRTNLEEKAESVISRFYQLSDVKARLNERLAITKKKLDDSVVKGVELQNNNSVFSDKNEIFNKECEKEKMNLVQSISEWSNMVSELSDQFLTSATLYHRDNLHNDLLKKTEEAKDLLCKVEETKFKLEKQEESKSLLEKELEDQNTCRNFLNSAEASRALSILHAAIDEQKRKKLLLAEKLELERYISENEQSIL